MILRTISKIVYYFLVVFTIGDIFIIINYFLRDYGEKINIADIKETAVIFFSITIGLFIANYFLKKYKN